MFKCLTLQGIGLPSRLSFVAKWSTPGELNVLLCVSYLGFSYGNLLCLHMSSLLCVHGPFGGWPSVYYLMALLGVLYVMVIQLFLSDTPHKHPYISKQELMQVYSRYNICLWFTIMKTCLAF